MRPHAVFLVLLLVPFAASAHLAGGSDVTIGDRIFDFGFDPKVPVAGQPLTLAFNAADAATRSAVVPDAVWMRIADDDTLAFAGTLTPAGANVTVSMLAPAEGAYDVTAHYLFGEEKVEVAFPLAVTPAPLPAAPDPPKPPLLPYAASAAAGACLGLAVGRTRGRQSSPHH